MPAVPQRIGLVIGVRLYREGVARVLSSFDDFTVVITAASLQDELEAVAAARPDALLIDASLIRSLCRHRAELFPDTRVVFGQRASRIPLHYDTFDNLLAQVRGEKAIRLYGPWHTPDLYPGLDGAEFASHVDPERPDYARHPRFRRVRAEHELVLREGDCLYLPPFWWHSVRALTNANISINYWYDTAFGEPRAPLAATRDLLRIALDQIRRLPGQQRLQALRDAECWLAGLREAGVADNESRPEPRRVADVR